VFASKVQPIKDTVTDNDPYTGKNAMPPPEFSVLLLFLNVEFNTVAVDVDAAREI
jgi:hypothetical protein